MKLRTRALGWAATWLVLSIAGACLSASEVLAVVPGDSFEDPIPVGSLPFLATGSTCGFADDIPKPCLPSPQGAPDVVYRFIPDHDMIVTISTCGSSFDGTFNVLDSTRATWICGTTDCLNGGYADLRLQGGSTYYVVVDSEYGLCGEYILSIDECAGKCKTVIVRCPADAFQEGENSCVPGYVDDFNGGCVSGVCYVSPVPCTGSDVTICGTIGRYGDEVDVDTYEFEQSAASQVTITLSGGKTFMDARLTRLADGTVPEVQVDVRRIIYGIAFNRMLDSGRYRLQLNSDTHHYIPCDNPCLVQFSGLSCTPTPAKRSSWGTLKRIYR